MEKPISSTGRSQAIKIAAACLALFAFGLSGSGASAAETFPPRTNIRLTIVQWVPTKSLYEKWEALGGEFTISDDGTLTLPIIGTIPVDKVDGTGLAARIADRMKTKMGLVESPEVSVAVIDYPPVYVVGDVAAPGEYKYRPGLSVLQSLALGGGVYRSETDSDKNHATTIGTLRGLENSILRGEIRAARLQAEMAEATDFSFDLQAARNRSEASAILNQERAIFEARANLVERQAKSYVEQRDLLSTEITSLEKKAVGVDEDIQSIEKELQNIRRMVQKGITLPGRQSDMERMLRSYQANRLDLATATMRARQSVTETSRNLDGLYDRQRADVVTELQAEQANLDQLRVKRETTQAQLLDALYLSADAMQPPGQAILEFKVERRIDGKIENIEASETTLLEPGDVVRVARKVQQEVATTNAHAALPVSDASEPGLSQ
jgi:protein involved in polysaccharide export with SLBB domain